MQLLIIWLSSVVASFIMEITNDLRLVKDVADNDCKIDINKLKKFSHEKNFKYSKTVLLSLLIPFINLMGVLQRTVQYNNERTMIIDKLNVLDALIPMTKEEIEEYKQKPTSLKALVMTAKSTIIAKEEIITVSFNKNDKYNLIRFRIDENNNKIITEVEGPIADLSIFEQRVQLETEIKKRISNEELKEILKEGNTTIDLSSLPFKDEIIDIELNNNVIPHKKQLEEFKNIISNLNDSSIKKIKEKEKDLTLKK